jgi:pyruvate formate lyase activating enzyme
MNVEARYYAKDNEHITCHLCPHTCAILPGKKGICRSRMNENGTLYAINYGETTSMAIDPVEKKPLYHYFPGRSIVSIAPNNCNMRCPFCQNWEISQEQVKTHFISPETLVNMMQNHDSFGIAYTYTEPLMWYEYLLDAGKAIHQAGGKNVLVTNGVINREPLEELLPFIDAMNIDLKTMDEQAYAKILGGDLNAVKQTIEIARSQCHVEITNLLVTGFNDKKKDMDALIDYIASLSKDIPVHFSAIIRITVTSSRRHRKKGFNTRTGRQKRKASRTYISVTFLPKTDPILTVLSATIFSSNECTTRHSSPGLKATHARNAARR